MADTGWLTAGTISTASYGAIPWANPGNAASEDGSYATLDLVTTFSFSEYLQFTNFGASIPAGSTIDGIECLIKAKYESDDSGGGFVYEEELKILIGGFLTGTDLGGSTWGGWPEHVPGSTTIGSPTNLWGTTMTRDQAVASTTGVSLVAGLGVINEDGTVSGYLDALRLKFYYTAPAPPATATGKFFQFFRDKCKAWTKKGDLWLPPNAGEIWVPQKI